MRAKADKLMHVGTRVEPSVRADLEAMAMAYPLADGSRGNLSAALRVWLTQGKALYDASRLASVRAFATTHDIPMEAAWGRIIDAGLRAEEVAAQARAAQAAKAAEMTEFAHVVSSIFTSPQKTTKRRAPK